MKKRLYHTECLCELTNGGLINVFLSSEILCRLQEVGSRLQEYFYKLNYEKGSSKILARVGKSVNTFTGKRLT